MIPKKYQEDIEKSILEDQAKSVPKEAEVEGDKDNIDADKVDNPPVDVKNADSEENVVQEKSEVKFATEARDTSDLVKGKQIYVEDLEFT